MPNLEFVYLVPLKITRFISQPVLFTLFLFTIQKDENIGICSSSSHVTCVDLDFIRNF